jgi:hypothetical protein
MKSINLAEILGPLQTWLTSAAISPVNFGRRGKLDPRELSDHLNRDLGFLDGKTPAGTIR